jgi:hypothetical protein
VSHYSAFSFVTRFSQKNGVVLTTVGTKPYLRTYKKMDYWVWKDQPYHPKHLLTEEVINEQVLYSSGSGLQMPPMRLEYLTGRIFMPSLLLTGIL